MRHFSLPTSILLLFLSIEQLSAEEVSGGLSEIDFLSDQPIPVTSATRLKQEPRNVPASVTVIDRRMIEASSATNIIELLRLAPGFQVGCRYGNECTATYHGLSSEHNTRLHILINGRSLYDPIFGGALWYSLPITIDEIESIEVLRGPNAASYGANSFSGVVNIKTFSAGALEGTNLSLDYGDERNTRKLRVIHSDQMENTSFRVSFEVEGNDGFSDALLDRIPTLPYYDDYSHAQFNTQIEHVASDGVVHSLEFGVKDVSLGGGFENFAALGLPHRDKKALSFYENYIWKKSLSLLETKKIQFSHTYIDYDDMEITADGGHKDAHANPPALPAPLAGDHLIYLFNDFHDQRFDLEYEHSAIHTPALQTVWGAGLRYDMGESRGYLGGSMVDRTSARLFGHVEWKALPNLILNTGGLLESYEKIGTCFSPRLATNFHLTKHHTLRANWSKAYRVPSLYDEYASRFNYDVFDDSLHDWLNTGNPELEPEETTSVEIGYFGRFYEDRLNVDLRLTKERIRNAIDERKTVGGKRNASIVRLRFLNYGDVDIDSAELSISVRPSSKTLFNAYAAYANAYGFYAYTTNNNSNTPVLMNHDSDRFVPLVSTGVLTSHTFDNDISLSAQYNFVEAYTTYGKGDAISALETFDLKIAKNFKLVNKQIELSATVKNTFNNDYEDFDTDNLVGREAYFQIRLGLL